MTLTELYEAVDNSTNNAVLCELFIEKTRIRSWNQRFLADIEAIKANGKRVIVVAYWHEYENEYCIEYPLKNGFIGAGDGYSYSIADEDEVCGYELFHNGRLDVELLI